MTTKWKKAIPGNLAAIAMMIEAQLKSRVSPKNLKIVQECLIKKITVRDKSVLFCFTKNKKITAKIDEAVALLLLIFKEIAGHIKAFHKLILTINPKEHSQTFEYKLNKGYKIL